MASDEIREKNKIVESTAIQKCMCQSVKLPSSCKEF